jgi:phenylpropionate dioxygenase-like ring-hydroxylating dioxygenase large terminal subunit
VTIAPPAFADARNLRQRVRAAGLDPNHWYAVEYDRAIRPGQVLATRFWGQPIALYRGTDGRLRALEDRCAHRQLQLSLGEVTGCTLTCAYHGWSYAEDGALAGIPHDRCGRPMPALTIRAYPVRIRYGLVWLFLGDPVLAPQRPLPEVPELESADPWAYVPHSYTWRAHHSMVIDNLCDLTHAHLHRRFPSFHPGRLLSAEAETDRVLMRYEAKVGPLVRRKSVAPSVLEISYEYPYHRARFEWSGIGGRITYWTFLLPLDGTSTRVFFVFCYDRLRIPWLPVPLGHRAVATLLRLGNALVKPLLAQDGFALEAEQRGYEAHPDAPLIELNPVVALLHRLTVRKWAEHLAATGTSVPAETTV